MTQVGEVKNVMLTKAKQAQADAEVNHLDSSVISIGVWVTTKHINTAKKAQILSIYMEKQNE